MITDITLHIITGIILTVPGIIHHIMIIMATDIMEVTDIMEIQDIMAAEAAGSIAIIMQYRTTGVRILQGECQTDQAQLVTEP
jgi:hypothetical protein